MNRILHFRSKMDISCAFLSRERQKGGVSMKTAILISVLLTGLGCTNGTNQGSFDLSGPTPGPSPDKMTSKILSQCGDTRIDATMLNANSFCVQRRSYDKALSFKSRTYWCGFSNSLGWLTEVVCWKAK